MKKRNRERENTDKSTERLRGGGEKKGKEYTILNLTPRSHANFRLGNPTYIPTHLPTYIPPIHTYLSIFIPTYIHTHNSIYPRTYNSTPR